MSLRAFHLFFVGVSVVLAAFVAAWAGNQYQLEPGAGYLVSSVASLMAAAGLVVYGRRFQRRTRHL